MYAAPVSKTQLLLTGEAGFLGRRVRTCLEADPGLTVRPLGARLDELEPGDHADVDVVIHLAAWTTKRAGLSDAKRIVDSNVLGLQAMLCALDPPPRRVMLASTADVYGTRGEGELTERSPLDPIDSYAASKLLGEHIAIEDARARNYELCIMRIGHLYGPGEEAYEKFVPTAIRALMKGRPPTVVGDGRTRRDLMYVDDAAEAIRRLVGLEDVIPQCVNLAAAETYTLEEIAQTLIDIVGFIGGIRYLSDHANPASVSFDTTLLRQTIGDWHRVELSEGLRREIEHVVALERASMDLIGRR
jgi:nucleoside-diphosphate-sugar epimerase